MSEDKLNRYETLEKLLDVISHGKAKISWADKTVILIEDIEVSEKCKITK